MKVIQSACFRQAFSENSVSRAAAEYPQRDRFFSIAFIKAIFASNAIRNLGRDPVLFAIFVAQQEDALYYREPPRYWRRELMERFGIKSPKDFIRVRSRAIDAGLLNYKAGVRLRAATYWVMVPDWLEPFMTSFPKRHQFDVTRSQLGTELGTESGTEPGTHSNPIPNNPIPKEGDAAVAAIGFEKKSNGKFDPESASLPPELDTESFRKAWSSWCRHRREKKKPLTPTTVNCQLNQFARWGAGRAIASIDASIVHGWIGVFEPKVEANNSVPKDLTEKHAQRSKLIAALPEPQILDGGQRK